MVFNSHFDEKPEPADSLFSSVCCIISSVNKKGGCFMNAQEKKLVATYEKYIAKLTENLESADEVIASMEQRISAYEEMCSILEEKVEILEERNSFLKQQLDLILTKTRQSKE